MEFSFHNIDIDNQNFQMSLYCAGSFLENGAAICELHYEPDSFQFFAASFEPDGWEGTRDGFIGPYRTERNPIGVERGALTGGHENGGNPVGALMKRLTLKPGEEARLLFYLGTGRGEAAEAARGAMTSTARTGPSPGCAASGTKSWARCRWTRPTRT